VLARKFQPLGCLGISGDDVGAVASLDRIAVRANRLSFLPGTDSVSKHLEPMLLDEAALRMFDRGLPLPLPFGLFALSGEATLLGLGCLDLQLTE